MDAKEDISRVLITHEQIKERIRNLAKRISVDYRDSYPVIVCVLKGSFIFFSELALELQIPAQFEFIRTSSYGGETVSSGRVSIARGFSIDTKKRDVILVDDIIDTGNALSALKTLFKNKHSKSVKICTLLDKPSRREENIEPDYCGFTIDNLFVVGYGLDYNERYRNLDYIGVLDSRIYENKESDELQELPTEEDNSFVL